jgi:hypothetical protein
MKYKRERLYIEISESVSVESRKINEVHNER